MRIPFLSMFMTSPFEGLQEHAQKVKECAWTFQQAMECFVSDQCKRFEELREEIIKMESEADAIKRRIRGHIPVGTVMPVDKFQIFQYLREQDNVLDAVEDVLDWLSYRMDPGIPEELKKDFMLLVDSVIDPIDELSEMVKEARLYFKNYSDKQRLVVKDIIRKLRRQEHDADKVEDMIKQAETIGSIADHAENAGDMMRAMVAK